jgi:CRP/FNR family transcriptional regulator, cyclic AMP receptor protein
MSATDVLKKVPLFSDLSEADLAGFAEVMREREYPKNSVILFEDDPGDALYVVSAGQVKVVLIGEDGREVILSVLADGDFFGEMALIDDGPRSATVVAATDVTVVPISEKQFLFLVRETPFFALNVMRTLVRRLRVANLAV